MPDRLGYVILDGQKPGLLAFTTQGTDHRLPVLAERGFDVLHSSDHSAERRGRNRSPLRVMKTHYSFRKETVFWVVHCTVMAFMTLLAFALH